MHPRKRRGRRAVALSSPGDRPRHPAVAEQLAGARHPAAPTAAHKLQPARRLHSAPPPGALPGRLEEILAGRDRAVFICGIAGNQDELLDLFDCVFLLQIDGPTQEARLGAYHPLHPPGRSEAVRREIREGRALFQVQMLRHGAIAIDATPPTAVLADELLALAAAT